MKFFKDQFGSPWSFNDSESLDSINQFALIHSITLTPISYEEFEARTNPLPTFEQVVSKKITELEVAYSIATQISVEFTSEGGVTAIFQADKVSQDLLLKATIGFEIYGNTHPGFYWLSKSNEQIPFTLNDLKGLYLVMIMQGGTAFQRLQLKKREVREATEVTEVQAVRWDT